MITKADDYPIQGLWIGELGMLERLSMASFLAHGHPYHLYMYDEPSALPAGVQLHDANAIIPRSEIFQYPCGRAKGGYSGFANLFRYRLLEQQGGWWCDTDMICLRHFDFTDEIVLASEKHWLFPNRLSNAVMFCPPQHALIKACYAEASQMDPQTIKFTQNGGPLVLKHVKRLGLTHHIRKPEVFNPIHWYQSARVTKPGALPAESYAMHCFRETWRWRLKEQQGAQFRDQLFPADTLLGKLQRQYL